MAESTCVISMQNWVNGQNVVASWVIEMAFINNVVKFREFFRQLRLVLPLFKDILLLIPVPWRVDFAKILYNKSFFFYPRAFLAENT